MACELAAQAVRQLEFGPLAPNLVARCPEGVPGSCSASRTGWSSLIPSRVNSAVSTWPLRVRPFDQLDESRKVVLDPLLSQDKRRTAGRPARLWDRADPASSIAMVAAARANCCCGNAPTSDPTSSI